MAKLPKHPSPNLSSLLKLNFLHVKEPTSSKLEQVTMSNQRKPRTRSINVGNNLFGNGNYCLVLACLVSVLDLVLTCFLGCSF